jgi:hypothetical protein
MTSQHQPDAVRRWHPRAAAGLLVAAAVGTWALAAAARTRVPVRIDAVVGLLLLAGVTAVLFRRANTAGRTALILAAIAAILTGLVALIGGWRFLQGERVAWLLAIAAASAALGGLACAAALSDLLPGQSLGERMTPKQSPGPAAPTRAGALLLTALLVVGWLGLMVTLLANMDPGVEGPLAVESLLVLGGLALGVPAVTGAVVAGWRGGAPNRLQSLTLAVAGGLAVNWLDVLVLYLWELVKFPGQDLASASVDPMDVAGIIIVTGLVGAVLSAAGFVASSRLAHHRSRPPLCPR